jgi:hypothetical protein
MMLFRWSNRKKSTHHTPLIWRPQMPDQGSLKSIMKGAHFAEVAAIQEHVTAIL